MTPEQVYLSPANIGVLSAASGGVLAVTNTLGILSPRVNSLVVAALVSLFLAILNASQRGTTLDYLLAPINGCILFCFTLGVNEGLASTALARSGGGEHASGAFPTPQTQRPSSRRFFGSWL
tara:strand:- start:35 stop:400 length:366 start_codon:yes stop_codon:yes gene_type:complete